MIILAFCASYFIWWNIHVDIIVGKLLGDLFFNIYQPISCEPLISTFSMLENFFLSYFGDLDIIELTPLLLESVENVREVMTRFSVTVMDINRVQRIELLLHIWFTVRCHDLILKLRDLLPHTSLLVLKLLSVLLQHLDGVFDFRLVTCLDLLYEGVVALNSLDVFASFWILSYDRRVILLGKEFGYLFHHLNNIVLWAAKLGVLFDWDF